MIAALGQEQDSEVREAIVYSLGECTGTIKAMRAIVNIMQGDPSPPERLRAAQAGMCWLPRDRDDPIEWKKILVQGKELFLRALDQMRQSDPLPELREYAEHEYGPAAEVLNRDRMM